MRYLVALVMFTLALAATFVSPPQDEVFGAVPGTEMPPVSICPLLQAAGRSTAISVLSSINGQGRISTFAAGAEIGSLDFRTGGSGAVTVPAADAGAVGVSGGLVEMPTETTVSGVVVSGEGSRAAEACADIPTGQSFISGGSTASGASFELQLLNPYAGEAVVDLTVSTEAGIESDDRFDAVIVPALSTIVLDLAQIIPGRESIAVDMQTTRGSVLGVGRQTTNGEIAIWRAVEPGQDWWLPVPAGDALKQLVISSAVSSEVEYQVDFYGPGGLVESLEAGVLSPRGQVRVDLAALTPEASGVRVIATGPVMSTLWIDSPAGMAATTASQVDAPTWLLPGASLPPGGNASIVILNTGIETATITVRSLRETSVTRNVEIPPEEVVVIDLVTADGYRIDATGPVVTLWTSDLGGAGSAALGIPIQDG